MKRVALLAFTALLLAPLVRAVTKEEYREASVNGVRERGNFGFERGQIT